jgi:hypothetical protein
MNCHPHLVPSGRPIPAVSHHADRQARRRARQSPRGPNAKTAASCRRTNPPRFPPSPPSSAQRASTSALHHSGPAPPASGPSVAIVTMTPSDPSDINPAAGGVVRLRRQRPDDRPPSLSSHAIPNTRAQTNPWYIPSARLTRDDELIYPPLRSSRILLADASSIADRNSPLPRELHVGAQRKTRSSSS